MFIHVMLFCTCSLYDLHYSLLRHNLSVPVLDKEHKVKFRPSMTMFDPWSTCAPSHPDPRILYVISNGTHSSPVPRVSLIYCLIMSFIFSTFACSCCSLNILILN